MTVCHWRKSDPDVSADVTPAGFAGRGANTGLMLLRFCFGLHARPQPCLEPLNCHDCHVLSSAVSALGLCGDWQRFPAELTEIFGDFINVD